MCRWEHSAKNSSASYFCTQICACGPKFAGYGKGMVINMEERVYKIMSGAGAMNIAVGVVTLVSGIVCGTLLLIGGAKLLAGKSKILF